MCKATGLQRVWLPRALRLLLLIMAAFVLVGEVPVFATGLNISGVKRWQLGYGFYRQHSGGGVSGQVGWLPSNLGLSFSQSLEVSAQGEVGGYTLSARWTDNGTLAEDIQFDLASSWLQVHLGRVSATADGPVLASLSGFDPEHAPSGEDLQGLSADWNLGGGKARLVFAGPQVVRRTERLIVEPGKVKYRLARGNLHPGSEQVVVDGTLLQSGVDYRLDYAAGTLTFYWQPAAARTVKITYSHYASRFFKMGRWRGLSYSRDLSEQLFLSAGLWQERPGDKPSLPEIDPGRQTASLGLAWRSKDGRWQVKVHGKRQQEAFPPRVSIDDFGREIREELLPAYWYKSRWQVSATPGSDLSIERMGEAGIRMGYLLKGQGRAEATYRFSASRNLAGAAEVQLQGINRGAPLQLEIVLWSPGGKLSRRMTLATGPFTEKVVADEFLTTGEAYWQEIEALELRVVNPDEADLSGELEITRLQWSQRGQLPSWQVVSGSGELQLLEGESDGWPQPGDTAATCLQLEVLAPGDITLERVFERLYDFTSYREMAVVLHSPWGGQLKVELITPGGVIGATCPVTASGGWQTFVIPFESLAGGGSGDGNWDNYLHQISGVRLSFIGVDSPAEILIRPLELRQPEIKEETGQVVTVHYDQGKWSTIFGLQWDGARQEARWDLASTLPVPGSSIELSVNSSRGELAGTGLTATATWQPSESALGTRLRCSWWLPAGGEVRTMGSARCQYTAGGFQAEANLRLTSASTGSGRFGLGGMIEHGGGPLLVRLAGEAAGHPQEGIDRRVLEAGATWEFWASSRLQLSVREESGANAPIGGRRELTYGYRLDSGHMVTIELGSERGTQGYYQRLTGSVGTEPETRQDLWRWRATFGVAGVQPDPYGHLMIWYPLVFGRAEGSGSVSLEFSRDWQLATLARLSGPLSTQLSWEAEGELQFDAAGFGSDLKLGVVWRF